MGMDTIYFRSSEELRAWFAEHGDAQELWVGFYKKGSWWVLSAKQEATRQRRLAALIEASAQGTRIPRLAGSALTAASRG